MTDFIYQFSFFRKPISNTEPYRAVTIPDIYRYVVGHYAKAQTEKLRNTTDPKERKNIKATLFDYCTFSGLFRYRNEKSLIMHSGLLCIDFDHVEDIPHLKEQLQTHPYFDTELMFVSPSGDGVKWIISVELRGWQHKDFFGAVANCLRSTGLPNIDTSGKDVARACLLPHDPEAYINPKYNDYVAENIFAPRVGDCPF